MVFKSEVSLSLPNIANALIAANLHSVDLKTLLPSSNEFQQLCDKLQLSDRAAKLKKQLRLLLTSKAEDLVSIVTKCVEERTIQSSHHESHQDNLPVPDVNAASNSASLNDEQCEEVNNNAKGIFQDGSPTNDECIFDTKTSQDNASLHDEEWQEVQNNVNGIFEDGSPTNDACIFDNETSQDDDNTGEIELDEVYSKSLLSAENNPSHIPEESRPDQGSAASKNKRKLKWSGPYEDLSFFTVPKEYMDRIWSWDDNGFEKQKYASLLRKAFDEARITDCSVYVYNAVQNKKSLLVRSYCSKPNCKTFLLRSKGMPVKGEDMIFSVTAFGEQRHLDENGQVIKSHTYINGFVRDDVKAALARMNADEYRRKEITKTPSTRILSGNLEGVQTLATYRQIKSERRTEHRLHPDVIVDAFLDWKKRMENYAPDDADEEPDRPKHIFIHKVGVPLYAYMHSIEELQLFLTMVEDNAAEGRGPKIAVDATSQMTRPYNINGIQNLKCFYYVIAFSVRSKLASLSSAVLSQHDTSRISQWLLELRAFLLVHKQWPIQNNLVVVDGSYPLLYAVLEVFNTMTLMQYLIFCHDYVSGAKDHEILIFITIVRACCAHKMKNFAQLVRAEGGRVSFRTEDRHFILKCIGLLFMCLEYKSVQTIFEKLFTILLSKTKTDSVKKAVDFFERLILTDDTYYFSQLNEELICNLETSREAIQGENTQKSDAMYKQSPFYKDVNQIYLKVKKQVRSQAPPKDSNILTVNDDDNHEDQPKDDSISSVDDDLESLFSDTEASDPSKNNCYCPKLAESILIQHAPTLCLWTGIMNRPSFPKDPKRFANNDAEVFFKNGKQCLLHQEKNLELKVFCEAMRTGLLETFKDVMLKVSAAKGAQNNPRQKRQPSNTANGTKKKEIKKTIMKKKYNKAVTLPKALKRKAKRLLQEKRDFPPLTDEEQWGTKGSKNPENVSGFFPGIEINVEERISCTSGQTIDTPISQSIEDGLESLLPDAEASDRQASEPPVSNENKEVAKQLTKTGVLTNFAEEPSSSFVQFTNGLIADPCYYKPVYKNGSEEILNYPIGKFYFHPMEGIRYSDLESLKGDNWLTNFTLDAVAEAIILKEAELSVGYVQSIHSTNILNGSPSSLTKNLGYVLDKDYIMLFHNVRRVHWCLVFIDRPKKLFVVLDPMFKYVDADLKKCRKYMTNFLRFFNLPSHKWTLTSFDHPLQNNYSDCGIYVLYYLIFILRKYPNIHSIPDSMDCIDGSTIPFCATTLRLRIQHFLLESSDEVQNLCAVCHKSKNVDSDVLECSQCKRWVHKSRFCMEYFDGSDSSMLSFCSLCCSYVSSINSDLFPFENSNNGDLCGQQAAKHNQSCEIEPNSVSLLLSGNDKVDSDRLIDSLFLNLNDAGTAVIEGMKCAHFSEFQEGYIQHADESDKMSVSSGEICQLNLWSFQDPEYIQRANAPEFVAYPRKTCDRLVRDHKDIPLREARNPFPSCENDVSRFMDDEFAWCFSTLDNGIIDRDDYFIPLFRKKGCYLNYAVAYYTFKEQQDIIGNLNYCDYQSLDEGECVLDCILDVLTCLFIRLFTYKEDLKGKISYINLTQSQKLLAEERYDFYGNLFPGKMNDVDEELIPKDSEVIVMIHLEKSHYCLIIINRKEKTLLYIDPKGGEQEAERSASTLKKFLSLDKICKITDPKVEGSLKLISVDHLLQRPDDGVNCGVYCLYFLEEFLSHGVDQRTLNQIEAEAPKPVLFTTPEAYRKTLQKTLRWHSEDISFICCVCNIEEVQVDLVFREKINGAFVICMDCERYVHLRKECLLLPKVTDVDKWIDQGPPIFYCIVCRTLRENKTSSLCNKRTKKIPKLDVNQKNKLEIERKVAFKASRRIKQTNESFPLLNL